MITKVDLWIEGQEVKGLLYNGQFFKVFPFEKVSLSEIPAVAVTAKPSKKDRGERICTHGHISIYKKVAEEISTKKSFSDMVDVIKSYYPFYKVSSCKAAVVGYKRFLKEYGNNLENSKALKTYQLQSIVKKKHRRMPEDALCYDEVYKIWLKKGMVQRVRQAIFKVEFDYKPTLANVMKECRPMPGHTVRAALKHLKEKNEIVFNSQKEIYEPV